MTLESIITIRVLSEAFGIGFGCGALLIAVVWHLVYEKEKKDGKRKDRKSGK